MNRVAVVTGASSGIGKAIYEGLQDTFEVYGLSRRGPDITEDVRNLGPGRQTVLPRGKVHLLVNAAGIMPFEESRDVFETNFWGTWNMIQSLYPRLYAAGQEHPGLPCIINIASISGINGEADLPIYAASKAAVINLTKSLAKRFAPMIRVNSVSPGLFDTNLTSDSAPEALIRQVPIGREEDPRELVGVIRAVYETSFMTGSDVVVDGGVTC